MDVYVNERSTQGRIKADRLTNEDPRSPSIFFKATIAYADRDKYIAVLASHSSEVKSINNLKHFTSLSASR